MRKTLWSVILVGGLALAAGCEEEPTYQNAGERLDAAIERVEQLKAELAEAERELQEARQALGAKVEGAPETVSEVPVEPPDS